MKRNWDMDALAKALWGDENGGAGIGGPAVPGTQQYRHLSEADTRGGFISPDALISGDVQIGEGACIYPDVHVRAGVGGQVILGDKCVLLDGAVVKASPGKTCRVQEGTTVSHSAVILNAQVGAGCLVGRDAVICEGASVADGTVVHDGSVLPPGTAIHTPVLVKGYPPEEVRPIEEKEVRNILEANKRLRDGAREYCLHAAVKKL